MSLRSLVLIAGLLVLCHGALFAEDKPMSAAEKEFCRLDKNNDRELSFDEFEKCEFYKLEQVRSLPFVDTKDLEKDNNGVVSDQDLKMNLFNKADQNKNGKIDRKEWEEFYNSLTEPGGGSIHHPHMDR